MTRIIVSGGRVSSHTDRRQNGCFADRLRPAQFNLRTNTWQCGQFPAFVVMITLRDLFGTTKRDVLPMTEVIWRCGEITRKHSNLDVRFGGCVGRRSSAQGHVTRATKILEFHARGEFEEGLRGRMGETDEWEA